ncbi:MAG TPA: CpsB/CapC family capsule biosynthesis tyrosine phosphatase, partial [Mucilaginibacter sp.]|nr:CpsB/CapC family capsule biosynthesis tyrosine phosphatase [Mucilaginibacter sp.]
ETFEERINKREVMVMGGNYVLFELSFISKPPHLGDIVQKLIDSGYRPILAHPERYSYMDIKQLRNLREMGCLLQLNTISLTGYYGRDVKKKAESIIDNHLVDFISSDMHHLRHAEALENALTTTYLEKLIGNNYPLKNIMLK